MDLIYAYVDTCVLADIISQYNPKNPYNTVTEGTFLKRGMVRIVNRIIEDENESSGYIIASSFAFVELINKFNSIFKDTSMTLSRLMALMSQPPSWLIIEDINDRTAVSFCDVPDSVNGESVSSDDAIHVATAMQRGDSLLFLTVDHILAQMSIPNISFIST